jgi:hypothetical protein
MKTFLILFFAGFFSFPVHATCTVDSQFQEIIVSSKGNEIKKWKLGAGLQSFTVDNIALSVLVEPASSEINKKFAVNGKMQVLLAIKLYDERESPRKLLSNNYGPPNSGHGYGKDGPANGVRQLGNTKINVNLRNPTCK